MDQGGTGVVFGSVSCPELGMGTPGAHPSGQPCEEEGKKLGIKNLSSTRGPSKNQRKICFTEQKILLVMILRDFF